MEKTRQPDKPFYFKVTSLVDSFSQTANSLDEAKILAKWNFLKGYEITDFTGAIIERHQHFCPQCRKCATCNHLYSEHYGEDGKPNKCREKKCNCKDFQRKPTED